MFSQNMLSSHNISTEVIQYYIYYMHYNYVEIYILFLKKNKVVIILNSVQISGLYLHV